MIDYKVDDDKTWRELHPDDAWIFDKLALAKKLGYICGPKGVDVPEGAWYIVRPCVNFSGMGNGAELKFMYRNTNELEDGAFWCKLFKGKHLSIDYQNKKQVLCVEGFKNDDRNLKRWAKWTKTDDEIEYPEILNDLKGNYEWVNVESIGGKVIEVHLRPNPNFQNHNSNYVYPVWKGDKISPRVDENYIRAEEGERLGFYIQKEKEND